MLKSLYWSLHYDEDPLVRDEKCAVPEFEKYEYNGQATAIKNIRNLLLEGKFQEWDWDAAQYQGSAGGGGWQEGRARDAIICKLHSLLVCNYIIYS